MTDDDIIKALGFCESPTCECTSECPMFYNGTNSISDCRGELHKNALRLINRLQTEKDILCNSLHVSSQNFENMAKSMPNIAKATRIEAIKVFAEKLKEKVYIPGAHPNYSDEIIIKIDNLAKEMTEDQE